MAAAVSSPWAKPGAWALEAEEQEAELKQQTPTSDFPSLATAATTKTKKKKPQTISLAEFSTYSAPKASEIVSLPTGPRERSAEELDRSKGFRSDSSRWGGGGERRDEGERRVREDLGPSRADENDNWAASKKPIGPSGGYERRERSVGFFEGSKADEVDSWVSSKVSSGNTGNRFEKRTSFDSLSRGRDVESETWGRRREESGGGVGGGEGGARPRLVLQKRTLPVPVVEVRPESPVNVVKEESPVVVVVERVKGVNPFGSARPREEVLAEKGQDWKEIDEKLEADKLKDIAAVVDKGPGKKVGFGLGHGRKDGHSERSWRKSPEQSEEGAKEEVAKEEPEAKEEPQMEEPAVKDEANTEEVTKEETTKEEVETKN